MNVLAALIAAGGDGAVVRAVTAGGQESFTAPTVVVAAGAWLTPLLDGLVRLPPLTVTKQAVFHFAPTQPQAATLPGAQRQQRLLRRLLGCDPVSRRPALCLLRHSL